MSERITIKSQREIELMRAAGAVVRDTLLLLEKSAAIGMTTEELNKIAEDFIRSQGAIPSFLNYEGYPKSVCTSINDVVCHGIPCDTDVLHEGDIINGDIVISLDTVRTNAERFGKPYEEELHRVIIHGILHLCGINDKGPGEREIMEAAENKALAMR